MREHFTNAGKKETRQFKQVLNKAVKQGHTSKGREAESRTAARIHSLKRKSK